MDVKKQKETYLDKHREKIKSYLSKGLSRKDAYNMLIPEFEIKISQIQFSYYCSSRLRVN